MDIKDINLIREPHNKIAVGKVKKAVLPVCQKSIDKVVNALRVKYVTSISEIVEATEMCRSSVSKVIAHLKSIGSVSAVDVPKKAIATFICYNKKHELIYKETDKKILPRRESIGKVVDVLRKKKVIETKLIAIETGLSRTTVLNVACYLDSIGSISFYNAPRKMVVTFIKYTRPLSAIKNDELKKERKRLTDIAVNRYLEGGVTFQYLSDKYNVNLATLHSLVNEKRSVQE